MKTCSKVEEAFKRFNFTNDENSVKLVLAFIEVVNVEKNKITQFDAKKLGIVDDQEVFRNYD